MLDAPRKDTAFPRLLWHFSLPFVDLPLPFSVQVPPQKTVWLAVPTGSSCRSAGGPLPGCTSSTPTIGMTSTSTQ